MATELHMAAGGGGSKIFDDDPPLHTSALDLLNRTLDQFQQGIIGHMAQEMVNRDTTFKQHIPKQYYPNKYIPEYVYGPAYLLTTQSAGVSRHWDSRLEFGHNCQIHSNNLCRLYLSEVPKD